jgi:hypothetical protein
MEGGAMRRLLWLLPLGAACVLSARQAAGQLPAGVQVAGSKAAAGAVVPNPYPLVPEAGPWLICAAHYSGPDAPELARQVVVILRNKHRMNAWIMNYGAEERRKQQEEWEKLQQQYPGVPIRRRTVRIQDHCAVLVGGFPDMETASKSLKRVRSLPMPELKLEGGKLAYETIVVPVPGEDKKNPTLKRALVNPFTNAMVVRNPTIPLNRAAKPRWDPLWKKLNAEEEYSLLENKSAYTLLVKEYHGGTVLQSRNEGSSGFLKMLRNPLGGGSETLNGCAMQAHELARFLRSPSLGFKAYVLHTRTCSAVTVGGFTGPDDPELQRTQQRLAALKFAAKDRSDPVGLMPNPTPVEVPRP